MAFLPDWIKPTWAKLDLENPMIPLKGQEMKILRFMHAAYQTIRLNSLIIKQKSVLKNSEN